MGGDFNIVRFVVEKNKLVKARRSMKMFNELIAVGKSHGQISGRIPWSNR